MFAVCVRCAYCARRPPQKQQTLDTKKWTVLEGDGCDSDLGCGWKRGQIDVSSPNNAYIGEGGHLVIVANRHTADTKMLNASSPSGHDSFATNPPTSARLSTIGSADFVHGKIQVRAKVAPGGWGGWSGIWLLPSEERGLGRASCARVNVVEVRLYTCMQYKNTKTTSFKN